jgi:hypothetical protein
VCVYVCVCVCVCVTRDVRNVLETGEVYTGVWCGDPRERNHFEDPGVDGGKYLDGSSESWVWGAWTGSIWLRVGLGGGHLCVR